MLIIKCLMLKVKNLTLLSQKKWKEGGSFDHGCKINRALLDFLQQPSVAFCLDLNQNFVLYRMIVILGFFGFFRQSDPPLPSQNVKMRSFCNGF